MPFGRSLSGWELIKIGKLSFPFAMWNLLTSWFPCL